MGRVLTLLAGLGLLASVASANHIRLWLSPSREPESEVIPELSCEPSTQRLYIWAEPEDDDRWIAFSLYVDLIPDSGAELVDPSEFRQILIFGLPPMWNPGSDFDFVDDYYGAVAAMLGLGLDPSILPPDFGDSYILGTLTVHCTDCEATEVYLSVGDSGVVRQGASPGEDDIYFGWGDDPVASDDTHVLTDLPEAIVCAPVPPFVGDVNCDGAIDFFDIDPFALALTDPAAYEETYPDCDIMRADCDFDGEVDFFDIDAFVMFITQE